MITLHKEGKASIILAFIAAFVLIYAGSEFLGRIIWAKAILYVLAIFILIVILQFFRKPRRRVILNNDLVYAPADGKIVAIEEVDDPEYLKTKATQVSIFMSPINVHINWVPISGVVKYFKYHPGRFLVAWHPKSSTDNERTTLVIETPQGHLVLLKQIAGALARRIVHYAKEGDQLTQGKEFGFIKFGSRVDVLLPPEAKIKVDLDQPVTGNRTVLAEF